MERKRSGLFFMCFWVNLLFAQQRQFTIHTVAFYNVENLYDTLRDPKILDGEWTPLGNRAWTNEKYNRKISRLSEVISQIGREENKNIPSILGLAEIENRNVVEDLVRNPLLVEADYGIIHYDSPDRRGMDIALVYQKRYFIPTHSSSISLFIYDTINKPIEGATNRRRVYTRDVLLVTGFLEGEEINFIVNHWPSRSGKEDRTVLFREAAAVLNRKIIDSLFKVNPDAKIIAMGDFNEEPFSRSIEKVMGTKAEKTTVGEKELFNPFVKMAKQGFGTFAFRDSWEVFDQIMVSKTLLSENWQTFAFWKARVFKKPFMVHASGTYKGYPMRTGDTVDGYSDHFPVFIYLLRELEVTEVESK